MCEELKLQIVKNLVLWIAGNKKLKAAITYDNLDRLFVMDAADQITVDLTKFNEDYYANVFEGEQGEKKRRGVY